MDAWYSAAALAIETRSWLESLHMSYPHCGCLTTDDAFFWCSQGKKARPLANSIFNSIFLTSSSLAAHQQDPNYKAEMEPKASQIKNDVWRYVYLNSLKQL